MNWLETRFSIGAKEFLAKRHAERRQIPFVPICAFGFVLDEKMTAPIDWTGAVKPAGAGDSKLGT